MASAARRAGASACGRALRWAAAAAARAPRGAPPQGVRLGLPAGGAPHGRPGLRELCARSDAEVPPPLQHLREHPAVEHCELVGGAAYVVRRAGSKGAAPLGGGVEDWELEEYVKARMIVGGSSASAAPRVRFADRLPEPPSGLRAPFGLLHALDALFADADADGSGEVSLEDFVSFCRRTGLFSSSESEAREVFLKSRSQPSASEILFRGNDLFDMDMGAEAHNKIKFYDFQKLVLDAGIVEVTSGHDHVRFFVDERAVDVILRRWLAMYDSSKQGALRFEDYVSLIADYRMPLCSSAEAYDSLARRRAPEGAAAAAPGAEAGLRLEHLRFVLEQGGVLETGASVEAEDELGKQWRDMKDSQSFLPPAGRVFVADGREGSSPPKSAGSLRFVCVSDTHGHHRELTRKLPEGDVLLHAGDFTMSGGLEEVTDFAAWLRELPYAHKIVIAGNHDLGMDRTYGGHQGSTDRGADSDKVRAAFAAACGGEERGVRYLEDEECSVCGVRIYGSPWQPEFGFWAFNLPRGEAILEKWRAVPAGVDVLMVHGPALGRGDGCLPSWKRVGCADLLREVQDRIRPAFLVCGHVHESAGVTFDGTTHFVNACSVDEDYDCVHPPLVFDIPARSGG